MGPMQRRSYNMTLTVNGRLITEVIIDPHYEEKHPDINDELILDLVKHLDGKTFPPNERQDDWEFFMVDRLKMSESFSQQLRKRGEVPVGVSDLGMSEETG